MVKKLFTTKYFKLLKRESINENKVNYKDIISTVFYAVFLTLRVFKSNCLDGHLICLF